jgi:uncharacterized membrane protein YccC
MAGDPRIRASDEDRDRAAAALRENLAVGRLTLEEFNDRLDQAYAARTTGELDQLMTDLPGADLQQLPGGSARRPAGSPLSPRPPSGWPAPSGAGRLSPAWRAAWGSWLAISLGTLVIWMLSGASGGLWFLWVAVPLGALMLGRWVMGAPAPGRRGRSRRRPDHGHHHGHHYGGDTGR